MTKFIAITLIALMLYSFKTKSKKYKALVYDNAFIEKNLSLIPSGSFTTGNCDGDIPYIHISPCRTVSVNQFYMFNQEISNGFYVSYLNEIKMLGDSNVYHAALPDTLVWREKLAYNEPYVDYYLRHPAYANYPVVGVSYKQCLMFCEWLTKKYNANPKRKFKKVAFDLPDSIQREWASNGGLQLSSFPWGGPNMHNAKGQVLANFLVINQASIYRKEVEEESFKGKQTITLLVAGAGSTKYIHDYTDLTAPVTSYWPNGYGLYNMSGNVEEFIKSPGKTMGGSWRDSGFYLQNWVYEKYDSTNAVSSERGFRVMMRVLEE